MPRVILFLIALIITLFAVLKCVFSKKDDLPMRAPKALWVGIILLLMPIGGIAYLIMSWVKKAEDNSPDGEIQKPKSISELFRMGQSHPADTGQPEVSPAPKSPDDDPDYLFSLEAKIARHEFQINPAQTGGENPIDFPENDSAAKSAEQKTPTDTVRAETSDNLETLSDKPNVSENPDDPTSGASLN